MPPARPAATLPALLTPHRCAPPSSRRTGTRDRSRKSPGSWDMRPTSAAGRRFSPSLQTAPRREAAGPRTGYEGQRGGSIRICTALSNRENHPKLGVASLVMSVRQTSSVLIYGCARWRRASCRRVPCEVLLVHNRPGILETQASKEADRGGARAGREPGVPGGNEPSPLGNPLLPWERGGQVPSVLGQWFAPKRGERGQEDRPIRHPLSPPQAMSDHTFTLRLLAPGWSLDELSVYLYERIDDASLMGPDDDGTFLLEFDRRAPSLPDALVGVLGELMSVLPEATVLRVDEYDLATMADIAKRSGRTPESIRLLVNGKRGPGGFPPAAGRLDARTKIWRWADVAQWFAKPLNEPLPDTSDSAFLQAFNDALEIRRLTTQLGKPERRAVAAALPKELATA